MIEELLGPERRRRRSPQEKIAIVLRDEISEKVEYIPASFVVNQYVRPQYGCPCCEKVVSGQMPA